MHAARKAAAVGVVTALVMWYAWGAWRPLPLIQDEYSYVLQSRIFATGHWTAPPPPAQYSFQQPHVLTSPRVASKYPPGHALLMTPGALLGAPWLVPLLLSGFAGALVFLLIERFYGASCALFGWACWLTDPINLRFRPGYFSETTSSLSWMVAWWLLLRWMDTRRRSTLVLIAVAIGWCAITRPLTALAFAVPVAVVVLPRIVREKRWSDLVAATLAGAAIVALLPLSNHMVTGRATLSPFALYRDQYLPFDRLGFGLDSTPPAQPLMPANADVYRELRFVHVGYTLPRLPLTALRRLVQLAITEWGGWRVLLLPLVVAGVTIATSELWFAIACGAALFVAYLGWAHLVTWTIYYFEAIPVVACLAAGGLYRLGRSWNAARDRRPWGGNGVAAAALAAAFALYAGVTLKNSHDLHVSAARNDTDFHAMTDKLPAPGAVVFVRYTPGYFPHRTIVTNSATLATDRVWVVNDDPRENAQVMRAADGRVPLLFDEGEGRLSPYRPQ
jgi:hypothetical protein